jgi:hypothetical protein
MREVPAIDVTVGALHLRSSERVLAIEGASGPVRVAAFRGPALADEPIEPALDAIEAGHPTLALVLGGIGDDAAHADAFVRALGTLSVPTLVVLGGRDHPADLDHAIAALEGEARGRVIDAGGLRSIRVGGVEIVPAAGAPDGRYARDDEACGLGQDDVDAIVGDLEDPAGLRVLVAWAAPAPLRGIEGGEAGSARLTDLATRVHATPGLFAWPDAATSAGVLAPPLVGPPALLADGARLEAGIALVEIDAAGVRRVPAP